MTTELTDRPIFKPSSETERLIRRMKETPIGGIITWMQMEEITGLHDRDRLRGILVTARKHLVEEQACFAAVRSIGIKRLSPAEVVEQESTTTIKVRRAVKSSMKRLSTVKPEELAPGTAGQYRMTSAALGALSLCVKPSSISKLKQATLNNGSVDGRGALELFK